MEKLKRLCDGSSASHFVEHVKLRYHARKVPQEFDGGVVKKWLRHCNNYHPDSRCGAPVRPSFEITLIDCTTWKLHRSSSAEKYAALSYVWGGISQPPIQDGRVPSNASAVVIDAIDVAQRIGLRYLWVDQYCVDQTDHSARKLQLSNMDLIYSQAEVTIVAACGTNANYGLPGVGRARSKPLPDFTREKNVYLDQVIWEIETSEWSTRGWTFQEARLSRRLLCFIDSMCYWECPSTACVEQWSITRQRWKKSLAVGCGLDIMEPWRRMAFGPYSHTYDRPAIDPSFYYVSVDHALSEYSGRVISFDEDTVYAVMGVLKAVGSQHLPNGQSIYRFSAILGLPFVLGTSSSARKGNTAFALSWHHSWGYATRRQQFPSWTWAGWTGSITFYMGWWGESTVLESSITSFEIEDVFFTNGGSLPSRVVLENIQYTTEADTLHFKAPEIPPHWLSIKLGVPRYGNPDFSLLNHDCSVWLSENIGGCGLLEGLATGLYNLALISWREGSPLTLSGCIWILRQEGVSWVRSGIITIDERRSWSATEGDFENHVEELLRSAPRVPWEII